MQRHEPLFNVPNSVLAVIVLLFVIHISWEVMPTDLESWLFAAGAFIPSRYAGEADLLPGGMVALFTSPVTYQLMHGDLTHIVFNSLWLLAFGGAVALRVGTLRFLMFSVVCGVIAAFAFLALNWGARSPVIGASGAVAGLMGGTMRFLFVAIDMGGIWRLREAPRAIPLMSLSVALGDKRVIAASLLIVGINLLAFLGVGVAGVQGSSIAWESHIGGYLAGLMLFGWFDYAKPAAPKRPDLKVVRTIH
ncbi:MAG: rhomboid family intramembrane serine protease [Hyphomicrobiaceae bacterium]